MTEEELKAYAESLILSHATDFEYLSIFDMSKEHTGKEITNEDAQKVDEMINQATVTVTFA